MNLTELVEEDNVTVELPAPEADPDWARIDTFGKVFLYVCAALGIPGNSLSAMVWLRLHKRNSSAVYLTALAINDLVYLLSRLFICTFNVFWAFFYCAEYLYLSGRTLEPLLVLGFSVERLFAICWPLKAKFWCTTSRAKKVTASLTVGTLIVTTVGFVCWYFVDRFHVVVHITNIVCGALVPLAVLVLNVVVVVQVRRAASNAASANLGVQHAHHQTSTSKNSAVPTVMLVATSIIYVILYATGEILYAIWLLLIDVGQLDSDIVGKGFAGAKHLANFVFAYNFYVYLITGKQFRAELRQLFSRCPPSSSSLVPSTSAAAAMIVVAAGNDA